MPNRNYERGRAREYRSQLLLETAGYRTIRASGSHGDFDIVAYSRMGVLFIQCKLDTPITTMEREQLQLVELPPGCLKLVHYYRTGVHHPEIITIS